MTSIKKCANCGDRANFPSNTVMERIKLGWCSGCYRQWKRHHHVDDRGREFWTDESDKKTFRNPYGYHMKTGDGDPQ